MAANGTESSPNSSQLACPLLGNFTWREEYLTQTNVIHVILVALADSVMIPFTVLSNALVIFLVWRKRYLRKQKPCVLLACLAATDLLVGAVVLPLFVAGNALRLSGAPVCIVDIATLTCMYVCCGASLCHLVVISGERYVAIKLSLRYEALVTASRLTTAVATAWAFPVTITLVLFIALVNHAVVVAEAIFYMITFVVVPGSFAAICFCQVALFLEARRHRRHMLSHQPSEAAVREIMKKDKAARTTAMVVGAFLLSYAPIIPYSLITSVARFTMESKIGALYVIDMIACVNSLVNPIIYCARTQDFKRALRELFGCGDHHANAQAAGSPSRVVRRRVSEAPRPPSEGNQQIAPWDQAPARISRSHSFDLLRDFPKERRNRRKNSL